MRKMLHICLIALAALWGCAKESFVQPENNVIRWNVSENATDTKVYPAGTSAYSISNSFGCFALKYTGTSASDWLDPNTTYTPLIPGSQVRYFGVTNPFWSTFTEYYWPRGTNDRLHFASFSPYNILHNKAVYSGPLTGIEIQNYTVPADFEDQHSTRGADNIVFYDNDLMVSNEYDVDCATMQTTDLGPTYAFTGVPTLFDHIMTRLNFYVWQDASHNVSYYTSQTIEVLSLTVENVYTTGTFHALSAGVANPSWSNHSNQTEIVIYDSIVGSGEISTDDTNPTALTLGYIAMPQTIASGVQKLKISYRITSEKSGYIFVEDITEEAYLSTALLQWTPKKEITYSIELSAIRDEHIRFTATCAPWISNISGGNEIPSQSFHITDDAPDVEP